MVTTSSFLIFIDQWQSDISDVDLVPWPNLSFLLGMTNTDKNLGW
jgi:hypothetical protein